jgi:hypothetical protein
VQTIKKEKMKTTMDEEEELCSHLLVVRIGYFR